MQLSKTDMDLFYKLWFALLAYVNTQYQTIQIEGITPAELRRMTVKALGLLREALYQHPDVISSYVADNPDQFNEEELAIIREWRFFIYDDFILLRQLKTHAIFLDRHEPPLAYGVLSLGATFEDLVALPAMLNTVLLPFKGRIIYDGFFGYSPVTFSRSIRDSFNDAYQRAKSMHGLITSLPFKPQDDKDVDAEMLRFFVKSAGNREQYCDAIDDLLRKTPALLPLYHQEIGKHNVRTFKQRLREQGVAPAWFAVLDGMLLACGKTRDEVVQNIAWLLPREKQDYVHIFQWKN